MSQDWIVQLGKKLESTPEEPWKRNKNSIYKIAERIKSLKPDAYRPQVVSFGPYHHGDENLREMEKHKERALHNFLVRAGEPYISVECTLSKLVDTFTKDEVQDLMESYDDLDIEWKREAGKFMRMMILDGCFMLEILLVNYNSLSYEEKDPVFGKHGRIHMTPLIRRDMLMLENQIPVQLVQKLLDFDKSLQDKSVVPRVIKSFLGLKDLSFNEDNTAAWEKESHLLAMYRENFIRDFQHTKTEPQQQTAQRNSTPLKQELRISTAKDLSKKGVKFKGVESKEGKKVSFRGRTLELPQIIVDDSTESKYLNMIAFERYHVQSPNDVTSFVTFLDSLIDDADDVEILEREHIIGSYSGSKNAVAALFNSLSKEITLEPDGALNHVRSLVEQYRTSGWKTDFWTTMDKYFSSPWACISFIAAILLFLLTLIQTVFTVRPDLAKGEHNQSPSPHHPR